jgi:3-hydroxyisobutyrate dehydrogenase-like beta-hydroxyacid dehydrogenase
MSMQTIGQIGLGAIGTIYAGHLLRAEKTLVVYDADASHVKIVEQQGAIVADSPSTLAAASDAVLLALPNPDAARNSMLGKDGVLSGAKKGLLVVDVSTIDPDTARELYAAAKDRGVDYIEAPVSGGEPGGAGTDGARAANISFMVGGDQDTFERAKPLMSILGKRFFYLGPAGQGSTVKLISNLIAGLHNLVATEAFVLGAAAGIDPETLFDVFDGTDAKSFWLTDYFAPRIRRKDFEPGFSVDLQYKDHRLAEDLGRRLRVPLPFNAMAIQAYQMLRARGLGEKDLVETVNAFGEVANASVFSPRPNAQTS